VIAPVDLVAISLCGGDPKLHLHSGSIEPPHGLEARLGEDTQHGRVLGQDLGDEALDALIGRERGEPLEHAGADPAPLKRIRDDECDLGSRGISQAGVAGQSDHALHAVVRERAEQRSTIDPVGIEERLDDWRTNGSYAVESEVEALLREAREEAEQRNLVRCTRRPKAKRRPVAEDDVEGVGGYGHHRILSRQGSR
jgi:hypothetical protein